MVNQYGAMRDDVKVLEQYNSCSCWLTLIVKCHMVAFVPSMTAVTVFLPSRGGWSNNPKMKTHLALRRAKLMQRRV